MQLLTISCGEPRSLCRLCPDPAASGIFPTLSLRILPCVPGPLSRRSRGVHLPVSSSTSSAFPRSLSRSASRVSPSKRFPDGSPFRDCSHFVMFRPSGLLASQIVPTAAAYPRRAAEALYVRAEHASLPPHASDMLTTCPGNWWCGDLHPTRFAALSAAPVKSRFFANNQCGPLPGRSTTSWERPGSPNRTHSTVVRRNQKSSSP